MGGHYCSGITYTVFLTMKAPLGKSYCGEPEQKLFSSLDMHVITTPLLYQVDVISAAGMPRRLPPCHYSQYGLSSSGSSIAYWNYHGWPWPGLVVHGH